MPSPADDFLHRLLAAHHALDAFDHETEDDDRDDDGVGDPPRPLPPTTEAEVPENVPGHFDAFGRPDLGSAQVHRFPQAAAAA